jgi:hypothetical protein
MGGMPRREGEEENERSTTKPPSHVMAVWKQRLCNVFQSSEPVEERPFQSEMRAAWSLGSVCPPKKKKRKEGKAKKKIQRGRAF